MAMRGYKLQEFVAHSANVNCLNIGKKACRMFVTGGDDHKVNLWAIGKPTSLMSLCGHTSPVEAVAFDSAEVLILAGASSGAVKLWDLEEAKMVRTLTGHRSNCSAVEFHPFGEFFASGSADTNLRIWDIRKKGCIHTYRGHSRGISTIRFTPDGRWVVSGGYDNVVKVWDLTAGKLLHDFKFHEGHIRSLDFHPLEFLLATGAADNTVKFWDLETFELIGSTRHEVTGPRAMAFHPDGRTLFCGLDDSLKVYSWEPVICHDTVDVGWSTLGDLCIHEGKLLGCSSYRDSVAVWAADTLHIEPYRVGSQESECTDINFNILRSDSPEKARRGAKMCPDDEIKEIKNIYIDSVVNLVSFQKVGSLSSPKMVLPFDSKEINHASAEKKNPTMEANAKCVGEAPNKTFVAPTITSQDIPIEKASSNTERETVTFSRTKPGMLLRPAHVRRLSNSKNDVEKLAVALASETVGNLPSKKESVTDMKSQINASDDGMLKSCEEKSSNIKNVAKKFEIILSPEASIQENCDASVNGSTGNASVKIVNGVAVVSGRTRSLVERFERREKFSNEDQSMAMASKTVHKINNSPTTPATITSLVAPEAVRKPPLAPDTAPCVRPETKNLPTSVTLPTPHLVPEMDRSPAVATVPTPQTITITDRMPSVAAVPNPPIITVIDKTPSVETVAIPQVIPVNDRTPVIANVATPHVIPETQAAVPKMNYRGTLQTDRKHTAAANVTSRVMARADRSHPIINNVNRCVRSPPTATNVTPRIISPPTAINVTPRISSPPTAANVSPCTSPPTATYVAPRISSPPMPINVTPISSPPRPTNMTPCVVRDVHITPSSQELEPQISGRDLIASKDIIEDIMQAHDVFLSTLKSRFTKLQVVRHFWERNDTKGALNALRRLPDHSVQADVISVLMEKLEILTLDLFSCLLPVLVGLLDSKTERHINISLEMLLKLIAVFGSVVSSTVSAPRVVGVDLHAEQRLECCKQCFIQLQNIKQILPGLARRGGVLAKSAMELNIVLQES